MAYCCAYFGTASGSNSYCGLAIGVGTMIQVEVAFAPQPHTQWLISVALPAGSTVMDALIATGWQTHNQQILDYEVGIFSQKVSHHHPIKTGDRLEIYRPLIIDPQNKRKLLSKKATQRRAQS